MDYYQILGVSKEASDDEIKRSFRELARKHHPDKGGDKEQFQKIQEAYEVLGDKNQRSQYDNPIGHHGLDGQFPQGFDIFNAFFNGNNRATKRKDTLHTVHITLDQVFNGLKKKFKIRREIPCKECNIECTTCKGTGTINQQIQRGPFVQINQIQCVKCKGHGKEYSITTCRKCKKGIITEEKQIEIDIEPGVESGRSYVIENWGEQSTKSNELNGHFIITINILNHTIFKRVNLDLIYECNISFKESIIGKQIEIPLFDKPLLTNINGFGIINPHKQYTVNGRGLKTKDKMGNLHIRFNIEYPDLTLNIAQIDNFNKCFDSLQL